AQWTITHPEGDFFPNADAFWRRALHDGALSGFITQNGFSGQGPLELFNHLSLFIRSSLNKGGYFKLTVMSFYFIKKYDLCILSIFSNAKITLIR
ncbi:MAG TPA: hypothetical protein VLB84_13680, partial [Bacteroidia bacterium]|nr:hypothetical protein [Bacteroidia bacterium]